MLKKKKHHEEREQESRLKKNGDKECLPHNKNNPVLHLPICRLTVLILFYGLTLTEKIIGNR